VIKLATGSWNGDSSMRVWCTVITHVQWIDDVTGRARRRKHFARVRDTLAVQNKYLDRQKRGRKPGDVKRYHAW